MPRINRNLKINKPRIIACKELIDELKYCINYYIAINSINHMHAMEKILKYRI